MTTRRAGRPAAPPDATTIAALELDPENRRTHPDRNVGLITNALKEIGAARSIVIDETGRVLAGNGVVTAAPQAGITKLKIIDADGDEIVAVRRRGLTPEQKRALAIYDNRAAELAEWNWDQLAKDHADGLTFQPFWTADEEARLLTSALKKGRTDPEQVPAVRATTIKLGDLFALGPHRLLCGDSADASHVARLLGERRGDALVTSPPYNVGLKYATHDDSPQSRPQYFGWLTGIVQAWAAGLKPGRAFIWNVGVSPRTAAHEHVRLLEAAGLTFVRQFIWHKVGVPVPTFHSTRERPIVRRLTSNYTHEMVYVMTTAGALEPGPGQALRNELLENDVFTLHQTLSTVDLPAGSQRTGVQSNLDRRAKKAHPAPFPVAFVVAFLQHYAGIEELVLEPFSGSGSTIIACEQLGAACAALELTPEYVQVAIDRWEAFTGQKARKVSDAPRGSRKRRPS